MDVLKELDKRYSTKFSKILFFYLNCLIWKHYPAGKFEKWYDIWSLNTACPPWFNDYDIRIFSNINSVLQDGNI